MINDASGPTLGELSKDFVFGTPGTRADMMSAIDAHITVILDILAKHGVDKRNLGWYRQRLDDIDLLLGSTVLVDTDLAVPVGGRRRSGEVILYDDDDAEVVARNLRNREGFPDARVEPGDEEFPTRVFWGEPLPELPDPAASDLEWACHSVRTGRQFGYRDGAIEEYLTFEFPESPEIVKEALRMYPA